MHNDDQNMCAKIHLVKKKIYFVDVYRNDNNQIISSGKGVDNKQGQHNAAKQCLIKHNLLE